jgi:metal-responsive CopG/Arc/MetJ family transcriptional regulator
MQVEIPPELEKEIEKAAERRSTSKEEVVLSAIRRSLGVREKPWNPEDAKKALEEMFKLNAPTCDIEQMLAEIEEARMACLPSAEELGLK